MPCRDRAVLILACLGPLGGASARTPAAPRGAYLHPRAPALLARYHFAGSAIDRSGRSGAFTLGNTEFQEGSLHLNGRYEHGAPLGYHAVCQTPGLRYEAFTALIRFRSDGFDGNATNILTGGTSYRWFGLGRPSEDHLEVTLNNQNYRREVSARLAAGQWITIGCAVDVARRRVCVCVDRRAPLLFGLPPGFRLEVSASPAAAADRVWSFTNYSNGRVFLGLVSDLVLYRGALSPRRLAAEVQRLRRRGDDAPPRALKDDASLYTFAFSLDRTSGGTAGVCAWSHENDGTWVERDAGGGGHRYWPLGRATVAGVRGARVEDPTRGLEVFVPDAGSTAMVVRTRAKGAQAWLALAPMRDVRPRVKP